MQILSHMATFQVFRSHQCLVSVLQASFCHSALPWSFARTKGSLSLEKTTGVLGLGGLGPSLGNERMDEKSLEDKAVQETPKAKDGYIGQGFEKYGKAGMLGKG